MSNEYPQFKIKTLNSSIAVLLKSLFTTHKVYDNPIQQNAKRPCWYINYYQPFEDKNEIDGMYTRHIYTDLIHEPEVYDADSMYDYYLNLIETLNDNITNLTYNVRNTEGQIVKSLRLDVHDNTFTYDQSALHYKFKLMLRLKKETTQENKITKVNYQFGEKGDN